MLPNPLEQNDYSVRLEFFSGPMDLLLHLVEQQEVDIEKVNLQLVCDEFLRIVSECAELDLDRASEYLVVAATLAARKSEALLPSAEPVEGILADEAFDPRFFTELRERLKAYQLTKLRAEHFLVMPQLGVDVFAPKKVGVDPVEEETFEEVKGDGLLIGQLFFRLLKRIGAATQGFRVRLEPITVVKYMVCVVDVLSQLRGQARSFLDIVRGIGEKASPRAKVTGAFVASLELAKRGVVSVEQDGDIISVTYLDGVAPVQLESEFDQVEPSEEESNIIRLDAYRKPAEELNAPAQVLKEANSGTD